MPNLKVGFLLLAAVLVGPAYGAATNLADGEQCADDNQCASGSCVRLGGGPSGIPVCHRLAKHGEPCGIDNLANTPLKVQSYPKCDSGSECVKDDSTFAPPFGICIDYSEPTSYTYLHSDSKSYVLSRYNRLDGSSTYVYQCKNGYYHFNEEDECVECPSNATCLENFNDTLYCSLLWYVDGDKCVNCPYVGENVNGGINYGITGSNFIPDKDITSCFVPLNATFSDESGTFTVSGLCYYTP